jgi:hypothetical protein
MSTVERLYTIALSLVALYLVLSAPQAVNQILKSLAGFNIGTFGVLQGRTVSGGGFSAGASTLK